MVITIAEGMDAARRQWASNIAEGRKALGLSQADLARAIDVTPASVCRWESGKASPRDDHKSAIAGVLRQSVSSLFPIPQGAAA